MKIDNGFKVMTIAGENIIVAVGAKNVNFNKMISLNGSGAFLWQQLQEDKTEEELLRAILEEYEIDKCIAQEDIKQFIKKLNDAGMLDDGI